MKKILSSLVVLAMMLSGLTAFAASANEAGVSVRPDGAEGKMDISVVLPDEFNEREIYVYILNPGMELSNLIDNNPEQNTKVFQFSGQKEYVQDGIGFQFKMNTDYVDAGAEPVYKVYANADTGESFTFNFTYYPKEKKEELLEVIKSKGVDVQIAEEIYKAYSLQYLDVYEKTDKQKTASLINTAADPQADIDDVEGIFAGASILAAASDGKLTLEDCLRYNEFIGVEDEFIAEFKNLRESGIKYFEEDIKADRENMSSFKNDVSKAVLAAAVYGNITEGNGVLENVITAHRQFFKDNGLDLESYDNCNKSEVGRSILSGQRLKFDEMVKRINDLTEEPPGGGGGTGGGNSGSGGSRPSGNGSSSNDSSSSQNGAPGIISGVPSTSQEDKQSAFTDLDQALWALDSIERLQKAGVVSGKEYGKFMPNDNVTREEFVQMICKAFGIEKSGEAIGFSDVPTDRWSYQAITAAASCKIVSGDGEKFYPSDMITREDMAAILVRVLNYKDVYPKITSYDMPFADALNISGYAYESVNILYQNKVISGRTETEFAPKDNATRAEAAKMICGALDLI